MSDYRNDDENKELTSQTVLMIIKQKISMRMNTRNIVISAEDRKVLPES